MLLEIVGIIILRLWFMQCMVEQKVIMLLFLRAEMLSNEQRKQIQD